MNGIIIQILFKIFLVAFILYNLTKMVLRGVYIRTARACICLNGKCERFINGDDPIDR